MFSQPIPWEEYRIVLRMPRRYGKHRKATILSLAAYYAASQQGQNLTKQNSWSPDMCPMLRSLVWTRAEGSFFGGDDAPVEFEVEQAFRTAWGLTIVPLLPESDRPETFKARVAQVMMMGVRLADLEFGGEPDVAKLQIHLDPETLHPSEAFREQASELERGYSRYLRHCEIAGGNTRERYAGAGRCSGALRYGLSALEHFHAGNRELAVVHARHAVSTATGNLYLEADRREPWQLLEESIWTMASLRDKEVPA